MDAATFDQDARMNQTSAPTHGSARATRPSLVRLLIVAALFGGLAGCESGFQRIDRHTTALLAETSATLGPEAIVPPVHPSGEGESDDRLWPRTGSTAATSLPTTNPPSSGLRYTAADDAQRVMQRLEGYNVLPEDARRLDLSGALQYAITHSREHRFAQEEFVLAALRLLIERHRWGPRFFNETSALVTAAGDESLFDTSLNLVNEFTITQRLPYGGTISARALAVATEDLHQRVAGENVQSAELILEADIPLLRGAGLTAREDRIQSERDMIYAARAFERFRREFLFEIASDFLDLVVQQQSIANAQRQVATFEQLEARQRALVDAGRQPPFEAALAAQDTLFARDRLNNQREAHRLALDRFKVRLGMPSEAPLVIDTSSPDLPLPAIDMIEAVAQAMDNRLDLQTRRDALDDARRRLDNARNGLLPDLNLTASAAMPTDDRRARQGLHFRPGDSTFIGGVTFGLPLDREIERLSVRTAQINLERAVREYDRFRDSIAVEVRSTIRQIDAAIFSLQLQEENIRIAERRRESIDAAPDRATARDRSEAADALLRALDGRDVARRDLQLAILRYLLNTDQLRVNPDGTLLRLPGMDTPAPGIVPAPAPAPAPGIVPAPVPAPAPGP
jgi:outer membrane protein TolC